jgi:tetratricopeptide (TPR) repeat protein
MAKILKMKITPSYYYDKALDKSEHDDFIGCLELLRRAESLTEGETDDEALAIRLEIADTLGLMGAYEESNRAYYRLTAFDYCLDDVYYGLIKNYALLDMPEQAVYYLNYAVDTGILSSDEGFEPIDFDLLQKPEKPRLKLVKPHDNSHTIRLAKQLLGASDTFFARQILEAVPESSEQFREAANYLALIELSDGRYDEGLRLTEKVLGKNETDINALTTRILALNMLGNADRVRAAAVQLDGLGITEWPETAKIALCFCQISDAERAHKYLFKSLKTLPYDRDMLLLFAIAAANTGRAAEAKDAMLKLQLIYPRDAVVRYYARAVTSHCKQKKAGADVEPLDLIPDLPLSVRERYTALLESALNAAATPAAFYSLCRTQPDLAEAVMWALYSDIPPLQTKLGRVLARSERGLETALAILIDPDYPPIPKKEIFAEVLRGGKARIVQTVINHEIGWFRPSIPKEVKNKALVGAYWQVYSALAFIERDFDRRLNGWFKRMAEAFGAAGIRSNISETAAAAILAYKSRIHKVFYSKQAVCEVFGCDEQEFDAYMKRTEAFFNKPSGKSTKAEEERG